MIVFDWYFGSFDLRQLIVDHINDNKDVYIDHIEGDFSKYVENFGRMEIGWNSRIICILKHDWCLNWPLTWCQKFLNKVFTNSIFNREENKWSPLLMITDFHFYYNNKCKNSIIKMTPREVLFNYKSKEMIEKVIINTEKLRKSFIQEINYEIGGSVLITSRLLELPNKRIRSFKREN